MLGKALSLAFLVTVVFGSSATAVQPVVRDHVVGVMTDEEPATTNRSGDWIFKLIIFAVLGYFGWLFLKPSHAIQIHFRTDGNHQFKGLTTGQQAKLVDFLSEQPDRPNNLKIYADRNQNGRLKITFPGNIDAGLQQRIRNFFLNSL